MGIEQTDQAKNDIGTSTAAQIDFMGFMEQVTSIKKMAEGKNQFMIDGYKTMQGIARQAGSQS
jgi:hypothetical protein